MGAGGSVGGDGSADGWPLAVGAMIGGGGQAAMVADGCCWRWRQRMQVVADIEGVGKRQNRMTS